MEVLGGPKKERPIYTNKNLFQEEVSLNHQLVGQYTRENISYQFVILDLDLKTFLLEMRNTSALAEDRFPPTPNTGSWRGYTFKKLKIGTGNSFFNMILFKFKELSLTEWNSPLGKKRIYARTT